HGYVYNLQVSEDGQSFLLAGVPFLPGKTGSINVRMDETGKIYESPTPGADEAREQMLLAIRERSLPILAELFQEQSRNITQIAAQIGSPRISKAAFAELDQDGSGKLSVPELLEYDGKFRDTLAPLLDVIQAQMQFGAGGEDVESIPSLTLSNILTLGRGGPPAKVNTKVHGWLESAAESNLLISVFCDGSVRPSEKPPVKLKKKLPHARISWNPESAEPGLLHLTDGLGSELRCALFGTFQNSGPRRLDGPVFEGVLIPVEATGAYAGLNAPGSLILTLESEGPGAVEGELKIFPAR
ncbi:MAG: hypothetical protein ACO1QR_01675, partial [Chthoniobacteraceae bacterium]